jgi:hypothetical protein
MSCLFEVCRDKNINEKEQNKKLAAADSFAERTDLCRQYSLSLWWKKLMAMLLTQVNNLSPVSTTPPHFSPVLLIPVSNNRKALNLLPVSMTLPKKCSPVSTTPPINFGD